MPVTYTRKQFVQMKLKALTILFFLICLRQASFAQNKMTGTWSGIFESTVQLLDLGQPSLVVEIYDFKDSLFKGITHLYYEGNQYEHYKMVGRFSEKESVIIFKESETIDVDLGGIGNCLGTYKMRLNRYGNEWRLDGLWESNINGCSPTTRVYLSKKIEEIKIPPPVTEKKKQVQKNNKADRNPAVVKPLKEKTIPVPVSALPSQKETVAIKAPAITPPVISQRETDVQSLIEIANADKDSIKVEVYDNGDIDGDSVSVYEENLLRINKKMITAKPITFYVSLDKKTNPIAHLRLVAESLGSIPPCTALMIITTKSRRYEVRLSSNFSKNATVEFFLKE